MPDTAASDRTNPSNNQPHHSATRRWSGRIGGVLILLIIGFIAGYSLGRHWNLQDVQDLQRTNRDLANDNTKLSSDNARKQTEIDSLNARLKTAQDSLDQIFLPTRTLTDLSTNSSVRVSIGSFNVGLVNGLGSTTVDVNINGQQSSMKPGDRKDLNFACSVVLDSFNVVGPGSGNSLNNSNSPNGGAPNGNNSSATFNTTCSPETPPNNNPNPPVSR